MILRLIREKELQVEIRKGKKASDKYVNKLDVKRLHSFLESQKTL